MIVDTCEAINEIGYNDPDRRFNAAGVSVLNLFSRQAALTLPVVWTMGTTLVPTGKFVGPNAGEITAQCLKNLGK